MELLYVLFTSIFSILVLFVLTKLAGNKQISELTMFDYIVGISIGSIAAEMATNLENILRPLIAMIIYGLFSLLFSLLCSKSIRMRRFIFGHSVILYRGGKIYSRNLKRARMDLNEFLMQCRTAGHFDLSALDCVIFEPSGKLSFLPLPQNRPATPADLKIVPEAEPLNCAVIIDGKLMQRNLRAFGRDENWLDKELQANGFQSVSEVYLGLLDETGKATFFKECEKPQTNDIYE